jgi:hypothetical protein
MRDVARIELPSTRAATTAARSALLRTFAILSIMLERSGKVKRLSVAGHLLGGVGRKAYN